MAESPVRVLERYAMYEPFASGGMAVVHYGRVRGAVGFSRLVAIKKLHPHFSADPEFVAMFLDEARLAARVQHPHVVQTLDAVASRGELFVILEYIHGESLSQLLRAACERNEGPPSPSVAAAVLFGVLEGLHAAHEARDERGERLELVHRDVSPQNVLVGTDGAARVLDFGIAKARGRSQVTRDGAVKGKLAYMAPEHIGGNASRQSDVFAAAVCLWEALTARRLFVAEDEGELLAKVLQKQIESPAVHAPHLPAALVAVVMRGLARDAGERFATAREMALALQASTPLATPIEVGAWVARLAGPRLEERAARVAAIEHSPESTSSLDADAPADADGDEPARVTPPHAGAGSRDPLATVPDGLTGAEVLANRPRASPLTRDERPGRARLAVLGMVATLSVLGVLGLRRAASAPAAPLARVASAPPLVTVEAVDARDADAPPAATAASSAASFSPTAPVPAPHLARSHGTKKSACSPAYIVDSLGLRHYKPECF